MPFMEWSDTLSVNNATIDSDHKRLIELVNRLHDALMERLMKVDQQLGQWVAAH
ncbi:MAG: hypothetical protein PHY92_03355 [Alphaproteobacteria bacterium]|nr:hypothetical protein [Alphaproteobacteria bacterium]